MYRSLSSLVLLLLALALASQKSDSFSPTSSTSTRKATTSRMATTSDEQLIPREKLFGNPKYASPQLSPDGTYLSFLAPSVEDNVLNVFVKKTEAPLETARMITNDKSRGIRNAGWAEDSKTILYMQDKEGDENFHLWAVDVESGEEARDLTPRRKCQGIQSHDQQALPG